MAKLYYSIKEISEQIDEEQHVLRYWEKEFSVLKPKKNKAGNRTYSNKDLLIIQKIKELIREQRLPVKEVKELLKKINWNVEKDNVVNKIEVVEEKNVEKVGNVTETIDVINISTNEIVKNDTNEVLANIELINEGITLSHNVVLDKVDFEKESESEIVGNIENGIEKVSDQTVNVTEEFDGREELSSKETEIEEIEKALNLEIDKRIVLKNHLFEDYEEFSVIPSEFVSSEKEKTEKEKNSKLIIQDLAKLENLSENNISEHKEEGIFISKEKFEVLIEILKEIRKII